MSIRSVTEVLSAAGVVASGQFDSKVRNWRTSRDNGNVETLLAFLGREAGFSEDQTLQKLSSVVGWPYLDLARNPPSAEAQKRVSTKVAFQYAVMPTKFENGVLQLAVSDPFDASMLNAVQFDAQCPIEFALAPRPEIEKALKRFYGVGAETLDEMAEDEPIEIDVTGDREITESDQDASVIKFVNQIIWEAFKDRATDIHFEPAEDELRIRYRIDGILHQTPMPPQLKRFQAAIISRIKVMSGMNISEKRLPQDGRINVRIKGEELDIRVSTVPTVWGESVSLRLLTRGKIFLTLEKLGYAPQDESALARAHHQAPRHRPGHGTRPARASRLPCTRFSRPSTRSTSGSSPSRNRSSTS
jgi:type II secretory ATPase GspE/PulE/Tfp pilus assembly ATPase PilB-like protein